MKMPNLLASKWGRLTAFFFLYMTEGIPLGFTATAVATQMRREGVGPAAIGAFIGSFYLPWAFKFLYGPFVDVLSSDRWGRRRMWIFLMQAGMIATLLIASPVHFSTQIPLFTFLLLIHNVFGATQDVAIDALAVSTLKESERGLANGLMFAGANVGQAVGGSCVLFLTGYLTRNHLVAEPFPMTFWFVAACIASVTLFIVLPLKEPKSGRPARQGSAVLAAGREIRTFVRDAFAAFVGTRAAFVGVFYAFLPASAMALGLALQSNLAVELGMNDDQVATLNLWSVIVSAGGCVLGGFLSDKFGRKKMLALFVLAQSPPTLYLMSALLRHNWIMPVDPNLPNRPLVPHALIVAFWAATLIYGLANGLMYGTRTALFMDVTTPAVAATQFTAYMALFNLSISYSAAWQGIAIEAIGYPRTLLVDSIFGLSSLCLLPFIRRPAEGAREAPGAPEGRARLVAAGLCGMMVLWLAGTEAISRVWVPLIGNLVPEDKRPIVGQWFVSASKLAPLVGLLFTITFVVTGIFLVANVVLIRRRALAWTSLTAGVLTLLVYVFRFYGNVVAGWMRLDPAGPWKTLTEAYLGLVPAFAAVVLLAIAAGADLDVSIPEPEVKTDETAEAAV